MDIKNLPWTEIGLVVGAIACYCLIRRMGKEKRDESRSAKMMEKYATLTAKNLAATPDEELVEAVVAHVLSRAEESRRPNPAAELAAMPQPYTVVYSVWAVCKEMARGSYAMLTHTATYGMVDCAVDGLPVIGAEATANALAALRDAYLAKGDVETAENAYHLAVQQDCPLDLCVGYIRDHVAALLGEDTTDDVVAELPEITEDTTDEA